MEQPPIRILRRPCPHPSEIQKTPQRPTVVTKTLEQREADYAAARKRIMGSATPDPAEVETKDSEESDITKITEDINNLTLKKDSCIRLPLLRRRIRSYKQPLEVGANRKHQQHAQSTSNGVRQNLNGTNAGLQQTTAITLMQQFNLLQQQYQQTLTGFQKQLVSSGAHSSTNFNPLNFSSSLPQSHINHKYTHPPTFN
uniref:SUZ domain-containing protein n=1 Tax=Trichobilharzia regenti TaxID=157069 RepID=A0AA85K4G3_TRIRE|nr:unnamed protein product [Trichobilharzia regenti]